GNAYKSRGHRALGTQLLAHDGLRSEDCLGGTSVTYTQPCIVACKLMLRVSPMAGGRYANASDAGLSWNLSPGVLLRICAVTDSAGRRNSLIRRGPSPAPR